MIGVFGAYFVISFDMNRRLAVTGGLLGMALTTILWILVQVPSNWIIAIPSQDGASWPTLLTQAYPVMLVIGFILGAFILDMASNLAGLILIAVLAIVMAVS